MTGTELQDLFLSSDFRQGLTEISSYLASIMQERPIVYLVAKCLWQWRYKFELEEKKHDLSLDGKRIEFKFNYDLCEKKLTRELEEYGDNLKGMWQLVQAKEISKSWGVMPKIYEDVCIRKPHIFVWIICSRDLSKVEPEDLERIVKGNEQRKFPYVSDGERLTVADAFLTKLLDHAKRPCKVLKQDIQTKGDFPSTYHFRICDFAS